MHFREHGCGRTSHAPEEKRSANRDEAESIRKSIMKPTPLGTDLALKVARPKDTVLCVRCWDLWFPPGGMEDFGGDYRRLAESLMSGNDFNRSTRGESPDMWK